MASDKHREHGVQPDWGLLCDDALWHRPQDATLLGVEEESITEIEDPVPLAYRLHVRKQVWYAYYGGDGAEILVTKACGAPVVMRQLLQDLKQSPQTITMELLGQVGTVLRGAVVQDVVCLRNCRLIDYGELVDLPEEHLTIVSSLRLWTSTRPPDPDQLEKMFPRVRDVK